MLLLLLLLVLLVLFSQRKHGLKGMQIIITTKLVMPFETSTFDPSKLF